MTHKIPRRSTFSFNITKNVAPNPRFGAVFERQIHGYSAYLCHSRGAIPAVSPGHVAELRARGQAQGVQYIAETGSSGRYSPLSIAYA